MAGRSSGPSPGRVRATPSARIVAFASPDRESIETRSRPGQDLSDPVIEAITEHVSRKNSPMSALLMYRLDGAYSQAGDDATAFDGGRSPRRLRHLLRAGRMLLAAERGSVRDFWEALQPHATDGAGG